MCVCLGECKNRTGHVSPSASIEHAFVVLKIPYVAAMVPALQLNTTTLTLDAPRPQWPPRTSEDLREPLLIPMYIREPPRTFENLREPSKCLRGPPRAVPIPSEDFREQPSNLREDPRSSEHFQPLQPPFGAQPNPSLAIIWYVGPSRGCFDFFIWPL